MSRKETKDENKAGPRGSGTGGGRRPRDCCCGLPPSVVAGGIVGGVVGLAVGEPISVAKTGSVLGGLTAVGVGALNGAIKGGTASAAAKITSNLVDERPPLQGVGASIVEAACVVGVAGAAGTTLSSGAEILSTNHNVHKAAYYAGYGGVKLLHHDNGDDGREDSKKQKSVTWKDGKKYTASPKQNEVQLPDGTSYSFPNGQLVCCDRSSDSTSFLLPSFRTPAAPWDDEYEAFHQFKADHRHTCLRCCGKFCKRHHLNLEGAVYCDACLFHEGWKIQDIEKLRKKKTVK